MCAEPRWFAFLNLALAASALLLGLTACTLPRAPEDASAIPVPPPAPEAGVAPEEIPAPPEAPAPPETLEPVPVGVGAVLRGRASYYGKPGGRFHGRRTASGERFDPYRLTAASNRFPLGVRIAVRRLDKPEHCLIVKMNDRMHARHRVRIVDLSYAAGKAFDMLRAGTVRVEARQIDKNAPETPEACQQAFLVPAMPP
ncbi:MAG: septal ring lytic transglycosylase RlpA family protein [Zoogloeaceae bacterium]|nr:septal ring lytic transglycosylase RlpA family protein [Zoogloeaceae bacterium]